jgi:formate C-acetyltransferase
MENAIEKGSLSERERKLKQRFLGSPYAVDIERARLYTAAWKRAEDKGPCMKAAEGLSEALANMTIRIEDDELLVGVKSNKRRGGVIAVEKGTFNGQVGTFADPHADARVKTVVGGTTSLRAEQFAASISDKEAREWTEDILPYWSDRTAGRLKRRMIEDAGIFKGPPGLGPVALYKIFRGLGGLKGLSQLSEKNKTQAGKLKKSEAGPSSIKKQSGFAKLKKSISGLAKARGVLQDQLPDLLCINLTVQGHTIPGYKRVLEIGFTGIADWADKELAELHSDEDDFDHKKDFYQSVSMAAKAVCDYTERYATLAEETAAEADEPRKSELLAIAERARHVPANPPRNFMEAIQSLWMTEVALEISYGMDNIFSPGRVDQYLYPFYQADLEAGRITRGQAREAVTEFIIKSADSYIHGPNNITAGGVGPDGGDATNEVSHMFLEGFEGVKGLGSTLAVRISEKTPRDFLLKAIKVHRTTGGIAFYNDEIVVRDLLEDGYTKEDARDYGIIGCVEPTASGNCFSYTAGNGILMLGALEMALNRGRRVLGDNTLMGVETPDPQSFKNFDDVKSAFEKQLAYIVEQSVKAAELKDKAYADEFPCLLLSATIEGCLENGKDVTRGGARYNHGHVNAQALASVANSLAAIKWAVFDEKMITMDDLARALRTNFQGKESLRQKLINKAPKYGNDDPVADEIAAWVAQVLTRESRRHKSFRGGVYRPSLFSSGTQHIEGAFIGATPDGRLATEVVSNGISPANGTEKSGMTAVFHSAARAGKAYLSDGTALNLNLSPGLLNTDEKVEKFADLVLGYFKQGGRQVQFNPMDRETLLDAQANPEKYPEMTVKVTGYSAIFVDIAKPLQDDIIARTEFGEL